MTIKEAAYILQKHLYDPASVFYADRLKAQALGIEALKRLAKEKAIIPWSLWNPLLGETAD